MRMPVFAAVVVPLAAVSLAAMLHPTTAPTAHACRGGQQPPTPAQLKFIADVHSEGLPGSDATSTTAPDGGQVEMGNWPGLSVRDSNILYAGIAICTALEVPSMNNPGYWKEISWMLGAPTYLTGGPHPRIDQATQYARTDLGC